MKWLALVAMVLACTSEGPSNIEVLWDVPEHVPLPRVPDENPLTESSIALGRHLFYDTRLSSDGTVSCASCHQQEHAFADSRALSFGVFGAIGVLNAPSLGNAAYSFPLTWGHAEVVSIEDQLVGPMFGTEPLEMGMSGNKARIEALFSADARYRALFADAYPESPATLETARLALASFVRSLLSVNSAFDRYLAGEDAALSASARRGSELFYSERLGCSTCHAGFALTTAATSRGATGAPVSPHHNVGLYNIDGSGGYPEAATGLFAESGLADDMGRFRTPSLRNVAVTAPYGHDGSVATLEEMIRIYEAGGRVVDAGPHAGDGRENPLRSAALRSFELDDDERASLLAFLESLTDEAFLRDPRFANPW